MTGTPFAEILSQYRQSLDECKELYLGSARLCIDQHPTLIPDSPREFMQLMGDLHKGLLIKIYVTISEADLRWSREERELADVLFYHIWKKRFDKDELRTAAGRVFDDSRELKWYSLIRPFDQIAPLRERVGELETIVMRQANLVAKSDGGASAGELAAIHEIQEVIERHLKRNALDEPGRHEEAQEKGARAVQKMKEQSRQIREQCDLEDEPEPPAPGERKESLEDVLKKLDRLIGMSRVKHEVRTLTNFLEMQRQRAEAGLPRTELSLHMVFGGNPGTGKTTVARIVGQIFGAMGVLPKGHLVETDRSGLVAEYAGQTGPKTNKRVDEALDGVLFIDEAYSLAPDARDDAYGQEAIQSLLKRMEDDRTRLVVVLAGYPEPMDRLIKSNPGLSSRFNLHLTFDDYRPAELARIFQLMCETNHYEIPATTRGRLLLGFHWLYQRRDEHFGNGRAARNIFETAIRRLANRIAGIAPITRELLTVLEPEDIEFENVPGDWFKQLDEDGVRFDVECPKCDAASDLPLSYLTRPVRCKRCKARFTAEWGNPVFHEPGAAEDGVTGDG